MIRPWRAWPPKTRIRLSRPYLSTRCRIGVRHNRRLETTQLSILSKTNTRPTYNHLRSILATKRMRKLRKRLAPTLPTIRSLDRPSYRYDLRSFDKPYYTSRFTSPSHATRSNVATSFLAVSCTVRIVLVITFTYYYLGPHHFLFDFLIWAVGPNSM